VDLQHKLLRYLDTILIAALISRNQQMYSLDLSRNRVLNYCEESNLNEVTDGVEALADVVAVHPTMQMLKLYECWLPVQGMKDCEGINLPKKETGAQARRTGLLHHADAIVVGTIIMHDPSPSLQYLQVNGHSFCATPSAAEISHRFMAPALARRYTFMDCFTSHYTLFDCPCPAAL
jgi:hypothetical protein